MKNKIFNASEKETYIHLTGGLGNQLFQYAAALSTEPTKVKLLTLFGNPRSDISGKPDIMYFNLPETTIFSQSVRFRWSTRRVLNFNIRFNAVDNRNKFFTRIINLLSKTFLFFSVGELFTLHTGKGVGFSGYPKKSKKPLFIIGYFQSKNYFNLPSVIDKMMRIYPKQDETLISIYKQKAISEIPLVVHIRLGDYKIDDNFGILTKEYYKKALQLIETKTNFGRIWIFSDEPTLSLDFIPSAYHGKCEVIDLVKFSPGLSLEIMRLGVSYIIANSSFSWWGANLSYTKEPVIAYPEPWFKSLGTPRDLPQKHWHRIEGHV